MTLSQAEECVAASAAWIHAAAVRQVTNQHKVACVIMKHCMVDLRQPSGADLRCAGVDHNYQSNTWSQGVGGHMCAVILNKSSAGVAAVCLCWFSPQLGKAAARVSMVAAAHISQVPSHVCRPGDSFQQSSYYTANSYSGQSVTQLSLLSLFKAFLS
jgi:hypothetical protein